MDPGPRVEVKFSKVEVDGEAEAVAVAAGLPLDPLDLRVDGLRQGVSQATHEAFDDLLYVLLIASRLGGC